MEPSMSVFADPEIYRTVLEHMQTGIYMVDCEQKIQFWSDGAENITGHLGQDVVGHFCLDFFPPQKEEGKNGVCELGGALASVLRDGRRAIAEVTLRHKAGHRVTVRVRAVPIRKQDGNVIGAAESMVADPWAFTRTPQAFILRLLGRSDGSAERGLHSYALARKLDNLCRAPHAMQHFVHSSGYDGTLGGGVPRGGGDCGAASGGANGGGQFAANEFCGARGRKHFFGGVDG